MHLRKAHRTASYLLSVLQSGVILSILLFIVVNFYLLASLLNLELFFYVTLLLAVLTDGLFILIHLPRRRTTHTDLSFDKSKVTVLIACYNGEDVIEETIRQAKKHVPANQIIVVSDASTDNTVKVASATGVRVYYNTENMNKAFSISAVMHRVHTPYVLILDDDTLIGDTFIPTSLLDEGYSAVAFNVMPLKEDNFLIDLQRFEYRKSMQIGKNLRARAGAIGNVSGAIGLFHTSDLQRQKYLHSGQFGGEDEQRTLLVHLHTKRRGITYTDSTVLTRAPDTIKRLFKQRAFSWNLSTPELFAMYWKVLLTSSHHFLLKAEKAYSLYIYATDPLRMLFFWVLFTRPLHGLTAYMFYASLSVLIWLKTNRQDKLHVVLFFPVYTLLVSMGRFIGHFYWYKVKFTYFFIHKHHRKVIDRRLLTEALVIIIVNTAIWTTAVVNLNTDLNLLRKIKNHKIDEFSGEVYTYNETPNSSPLNTVNSAELTVSLGTKDSNRDVSYKLIEMYLYQNPSHSLSDETRLRAEAELSNNIPPFEQSKFTLTVPKAIIEAAINKAQQ